MSGPASDTFSWATALDADWVRGDLAFVSSYAINAGTSLTTATSLTDSTVPSPSGAALYYLFRLSGSCAVPSWQTVVGSEAARDATLP